MKKQYRCEKDSWCKVRLCIYHDGKLIESNSFWVDESDAERDRLESSGYTYGYTCEEVAKVKEKYKTMLKNIIQ